MDLYSMPSYFQNMPVVGKPAAPKPENEQEIKAVEQEIHALIEEGRANGRDDESLNQS